MNEWTTKVKQTEMTLESALKAGYQLDRKAYQLGYVSRKINALESPVWQTKTNKLFVLLPAFNTTKYCIRQYLTK